MKKAIKTILLVIVIALAVRIIYVQIQRAIDRAAPEAILSSGYSSWYDHGMGQYLPNPVEVFDRQIETHGAFVNNASRFELFIDDVDKEEFKKYVEACRQCGFSRVVDEHTRYVKLWDPVKRRLLHLRHSGSEHILVDLSG